MASHPDHLAGSSTDAGTEASGREPGLLETARALGMELRGTVYDHCRLAALETRQAGESLVKIVAMGVVMASLVLTAWLALVSAGLMVLVQHALVSPSVALLIVFAVHVLLAGILFLAIRRRSKSLLFPATISRLQPASSTDLKPERSP